MKEIEFKAGNRAFSFSDGFEYVYESIEDEKYPFVHGTSSYTRDGKVHILNKFRSLLTLAEAHQLGITEVPRDSITKTLYQAVYRHVSGKFWVCSDLVQDEEYAKREHNTVVKLINPIEVTL